MASSGETVREPTASESTAGSSRRRGDLWAGVILVALSALVLFEMWRSGRHLWSISGPGPAFFPVILAVVLAGLSVALILQARTAPAPAPSNEPNGATAESSDEPVPIKRAALYAAVVAGMIAAFPLLGGLVAIALFIAVEMVLVERRSPIAAVLVGSLTALTVYVVFVWLLDVRLPPGVLRGILD